MKNDFIWKAEVYFSKMRKVTITRRKKFGRQFKKKNANLVTVPAYEHKNKISFAWIILSACYTRRLRRVITPVVKNHPHGTATILFLQRDFSFAHEHGCCHFQLEKTQRSENCYSICRGVTFGSSFIVLLLKVTELTVRFSSSNQLYVNSNDFRWTCIVCSVENFF